MKKQKIFTSIYIICIALSLFIYMGFFFLQMRKHFSVLAFINYWLIFALATSNIFVFFHLLKGIFGKTTHTKKFFSIKNEVILAWILILFLFVVASLICWHDFFINTYIPTLSNTDSAFKDLIKFFILTASVLLLLAILVLPQFIFLCRQLRERLQLKKSVIKK